LFLWEVCSEDQSEKRMTIATASCAARVQRARYPQSARRSKRLQGSAPSFPLHSQTGTLVKTGTLFNNFNGGGNAVKLNSGNVFIFGSACCSGFSGSRSTWEIRGANGNFVSTGSLFNPRGGAGAAVLSNGNVFITGGDSAPATWEIRNATGGLVSQGNLFNTRNAGHSLTHS
jgi:hypothetical protein